MIGEDAAGVRTNRWKAPSTDSLVLRRWPATLAQRPDWIICLLGGNDVTRVGPQPAKPQVTLAERIANLRELCRIAAARTSAAWFWITRPRSTEPGQPRSRRFGWASRPGATPTWRPWPMRSAASTSRSSTLGVVFAGQALGRLQGPDGVHPSLDGHTAIARALVQTLASMADQQASHDALRLHPPAMARGPRHDGAWHRRLGAHDRLARHGRDHGSRRLPGAVRVIAFNKIDPNGSPSADLTRQGRAWLRRSWARHALMFAAAALLLRALAA